MATRVDEEKLRVRLLMTTHQLTELHRATLAQLYFALVIAGSALPPDSYRLIRRTLLNLPDQMVEMVKELDALLARLS